MNRDEELIKRSGESITVDRAYYGQPRENSSSRCCCLYSPLSTGPEPYFNNISESCARYLAETN
ncbi:hypothetical protein HN011_005434, partial [Eciton burchellii]